MTSRALVIGEALIDIVERVHERASSTERVHERASSTERVHERASSTAPEAGKTEHVGGSPLNVAVGLGRLDRGVDFLTHIADDERGRRIVEHVEASGVRLVPGSITAARTPTAAATIDENGSATYTFDIDWQLTGTPEVPPPLIVHTGSIAGFLGPGCLATAALVEAYRLAATITYDPNVRPALIDDRQQALDRIDRLIEKADVVKVSDEDLHWIDPTRTPEQIARAWQELGPAVVAVTMGGNGAFATCAAGMVHVDAQPVEVVDTVGAGDSFMTGLIDALWSSNLLGGDQRAALGRIDVDTLTEVLAAAAHASAVTVSRAGADLPDRAALQLG